MGQPGLPGPPGPPGPVVYMSEQDVRTLHGRAGALPAVPPSTGYSGCGPGPDPAGGWEAIGAAGSLHPG